MHAASGAYPPAGLNPSTTSPAFRFGLTAVLVTAMASATYLAAGLGVIATFLLDDLGISRAEVGALISATIVVAAVASPAAGTLTDLLGGKRSVAVVYLASVVGFVGLAVSPAYWVMFIPVALAAVGQAAANPSTNKLIALHAPSGRRGVLTGVKQSGVQAGIFLGGALVPAGALTLGWRWTLVVVAVVPVAGFVLSQVLLPKDRPAAEHRPAATGGPLPPAITFLAVYGGLMGFGAAYTFLIPLFAEEALGLSETAGGFAAGVVGLTSLFARIGWARFAERGERYFWVLTVIAVSSLGAGGVLLAAESVGPALLWAGVVLTGLTASSWNSVGMLAVIHHAGEARAGRGSGIVMLGFFIGLGAAPPVMGWTVDTFDTYTWMWVMSIVSLGLGGLLSGWWLGKSRMAVGESRT